MCTQKQKERNCQDDSCLKTYLEVDMEKKEGTTTNARLNENITETRCILFKGMRSSNNYSDYT